MVVSGAGVGAERGCRVIQTKFDAVLFLEPHLAGCEAIKERPAGLLVFQDGLRHADPNGPMRATVVFDNLIHQKKMPVTIGVFINPGAFKDQKPGEKPKNRSFDFLGFTHHWGRSRKGNWVVRQKTAKSRLKRAVTTVAAWCRRHRHLPVSEQRDSLERKLLGHYAYYGITGNYRALARYRRLVARMWRYWLARRSQRGKPWTRFTRLLEQYPLPAARVVHSKA